MHAFLFHWLLPLTLMWIGALRHNRDIAQVLFCFEISSAKQIYPSLLSTVSILSSEHENDEASLFASV